MAHPIDLKAKAVALLAANEGNVYRTAKELGVSRATLTKWAAKSQIEPELSEAVQEKKEDLAAMCEKLARKLAGKLYDDERIEAARYGELNAAWGTSIDKMQLLNNKPTSITGSDSQVAEKAIELYLKAFPGTSKDEAKQQIELASQRVM